MANWYDENNNSKENTTGNLTPSTDSPKEDNAAETGWKSSEETQQAQQAQQAQQTQTNNWASPSAPVSPVSSWSTQNQTNTPSQDQATNGTPYSPYGTPNYTTYRYGVNAPQQVPKPDSVSPANANPQQPYSSTPGSSAPGGYQPQGGYDPYGWQPYQNQPGMQPNKPPKKKKSAAAIAIAALSVVCAGAIITLSVLLAMALSDGGLKLSGSSSSSSSNTSTTINANAPSLEISEDTEDATALSTRAIVNKNISSTVVITIYTQSSSSYYNYDSSSSTETEAGAASGIIMTADGYIITNWHVVCDEDTGKQYDRIDVTTYDGTVYEDAEVVGADQYTDLAVIKINASDLTPAEFGDSSDLCLGDKIVAIGNAGGLEWTITQGIVSGLARDVYEDTGYSIKCLQIDAAINPGNSGGPLLNSQGQVVGINSAKIVATGYEGLGFSIPINEAKTIIDDLLKYGYVKGRVMLGITGTTITSTGYEGFRIETISTDSCLSGTDAAVGDIITYIEDTRVTDYSTLRSQLSTYSVGDTVELTLLRYNQRTRTSSTFTIKVTLKEAQS